MKLIELMQRTGNSDIGLTKSDLKRALIEMESLIQDRVIQAHTDIAVEQRYYGLPDSMVNLLDVRVKYTESNTTKYRKIPRIMMVEEVDEDGV